MDAHIDLTVFRGAIMFEESLVESTTLLRSGNRWPTVISFSVQASVVAALIAIPLLHPEAILLKAPALTALTLPPKPLLPPPRPRPIMVSTTSAASATLAAPSVPASQPPLIRSTGTPVDAPLLAVGLNMAADIPNPTAVFGLGGTGTSHIVVAQPSVTSGSGTVGKPITLSRGVSAGLLLGPIQPEYPAIARISRSEGTVVIQAIISKSGRIESAHVLSGPVLFQASALQAVRAARYRPYLLNDEPTEVETTITITFRLSS
jgi:protein TonB